ncbi:MAG: L-histidine N(alpha)-methyltransferase [Deltaproteobacteria bacterium]
MKIELIKEDKVREYLFKALRSHRLPEMSARPECRQLTELLKDKMKFLAESIPEGVTVASLGAGDGEREGIILKALAAKGAVEYCALDINGGMLDRAMERLEGPPGLKKTAFVGYLDDLPKLKSSVSSPVLCCCLGNAFCSHEPSSFLSLLADSLTEQDLFLMDCHLGSQQEQEKNISGSQPFPDLGLTAESVELRTELLPTVTAVGQAMRARRSLLVQKDCKMSLSEVSVPLKKGEELEIGSVYTYKFSQVVALLKKARFQTVRVFLSDNNEDLVILARPLGEGYLQYSMMGR